jgi:hypothetical protein
VAIKRLAREPATQSHKAMGSAIVSLFGNVMNSAEHATQAPASSWYLALCTSNTFSRRTVSATTAQ